MVMALFQPSAPHPNQSNISYVLFQQKVKMKKKKHIKMVRNLYLRIFQNKLRVLAPSKVYLNFSPNDVGGKKLSSSRIETKDHFDSNYCVGDSVRFVAAVCE